MSASSVVEKATSDMLIGPDWALNLDLCDAINNDPTQAREIVKAVKKRLTNRSPHVQLLALTVLETLIKNCGDHVHQQVAEKDVLHELVKLVKKKSKRLLEFCLEFEYADMRVRDKTLVLLDQWQEAFGGSSGRYPQYYIAYSELQKAGVEFPRRGGQPSSPIFTPPQTQPLSSPRSPAPRSPGPLPARPGDAENISGLSLAEIKQAQNLVELLQDMVKALNPRDRMSAKEEVIVELVDQCRINQQRVMKLVNDTSDEQLLGQGLSLNDELQRVLARYDAFLSGAAVFETSPERTRMAPKAQTQTESQSSPQGASGASTRVKGSARSIFPALTIPPPPATGKRPATQSSSAAPAATSPDASYDLLSGDPTYQLLSGEKMSASTQSEASPASSMALTVIDQPQPQPEQKVTDLLALPAPEGFSNPFDSSPFQASPSTESMSPAAYPPQSFAETPVLRSENSWAAPPCGWESDAVEFLYGAHPTESMSGPAVQPQYYNYPQSQPVSTTPPPWQEDTQAPEAPQQWQAPSHQAYGYGGNTTWNSGQQQPGMGVMQEQYPGTGYAGFSTRPSSQQSWSSNDSTRLGQVGTGPGENFGSQYLNQRGISGSFKQSSTRGASQQQYSGALKPSVNSPDTLFHDLVDFRSMSATLKAASLANKAPSTSKAGP